MPMEIQQTITIVQKASKYVTFELKLNKVYPNTLNPISNPYKLTII